MLLTSKEVLAILRIKDQNVLGWIVQRGLLPRVVLGPRTYRYYKTDVEELIERVKNEGILLTIKP